MMLALTGVKSYFPNSFPLLQVKPFILPTVSLVAEKKHSGLCCYLWCYRPIMIVQLMIEQGQVIILTVSIVKGRRPFYWILLKEANLYNLRWVETHAMIQPFFLYTVKSETHFAYLATKLNYCIFTFFLFFSCICLLQHDNLPKHMYI